MIAAAVVVPAAAALPGPYPDLILDDLEWGEVHANAPFVFEAFVRNGGYVPSGPFLVAFFLDGAPAGTRNVSSLPAGAGFVVESDPIVASAGRHNLSATADSTNVVFETYEFNNNRSEMLEIATSEPPRADLSIRELAPLNATAGSAARFRVVVRNAGDAASPLTLARVRVDGVLLDEVEVPALAVGAEHAFTTNRWNATSGDHVATAMADAWGEVAESNESNNARTIAFHVGPPAPDLVVSSFLALPSEVEYGEPMTFRVQVRNNGVAWAGSSTLRVDANGTALHADVPPLAPGAKATLTLGPWIGPAGSHALIAVADADSEVTESNETNNARATIVFVAPPRPDFVARIVAVARESVETPWVVVNPHALSPRTILIETCNVGAGAGTTRIVAFGTAELAGQGSRAAFGQSNEIALAAGACETRNFTTAADLLLGDVDLVAIAEVDERESNESNNVDVARETFLVKGQGGIAQDGPAAPAQVPPPLPDEISSPAPGSDPRCATFEAVGADCAWPWGLWDLYSDNAVVRSRVDVCVNLGGPYGLLSPACNFVDHPSSPNNAVGNSVVAQVRAPRVRPSEYMDHAMRFTTTGAWGGPVALGEARFAGGVWEPVSIELPEHALFSSPYRAWLYANCRLNQTFGASEACASPR